MARRLAPSMRLHRPWLAAVLIAISVAAWSGHVVDANAATHNAFVIHADADHDDNRSYLAVTVIGGEPGDVLRTAGYSNAISLPPEDAHDPELGHDIRELIAFPGRLAVTEKCGHHAYVDGELEPLLEWEDVFAPRDIPWPTEASSRCPEGPTGIDLVWILHNDTAAYDQLAAFRGNGIEGYDDHQLRIVDGDSLARGPALRGLGWAALVAGAIVGLAPGARPSLPGHAGGPIGAAGPLAEVGERFLRDLRNAHVAILGLLATLGIASGMALLLWAGSLSDGRFSPAREAPYAAWQTDVFYGVVAALTVALLVAARRAWDLHQTLQRWRRRVADAPIEGELDP